MDLFLALVQFGAIALPGYLFGLADLPAGGWHRRLEMFLLIAASSFFLLGFAAVMGGELLGRAPLDWPGARLLLLSCLGGSLAGPALAAWLGTREAHKGGRAVSAPQQEVDARHS